MVVSKINTEGQQGVRNGKNSREKLAIQTNPDALLSFHSSASLASNNNNNKRRDPNQVFAVYDVGHAMDAIDTVWSGTWHSVDMFMLGCCELQLFFQPLCVCGSKENKTVRECVSQVCAVEIVRVEGLRDAAWVSGPFPMQNGFGSIICSWCCLLCVWMKMEPAEGRDHDASVCGRVARKNAWKAGGDAREATAKELFIM